MCFVELTKKTEVTASKSGGTLSDTNYLHALNATLLVEH